jgi:alpha-tubulin suppressor-like RCC1 family protein
MQKAGRFTNTFSENTAVTVSGVAGVTAIAAGFYHSCALLADATVKCWGYNIYGGLGNGTSIDSNTPVSVIGL